ncbi:hypothetical protein MLD38_005191 [Melastoma candidum]|uniref:Uncharacterized protein n=1 Tax=Melastoma candidum TaxID=119954 RepID=A0ACB9SGN6_9MYRT|nr:hypothetical protein MLD38_005191 [Melastoma candidum]
MEHRLPSSHYHPSFSSSLLDAIYRSIDQSDLPPPPHQTESLLTFSREDSTKGVPKSKGGAHGEMYRHNMCVDKWSAVGIRSERYLVVRRESSNRSFVLGSSSGSSSDSSGFSSSESEFASSRSSHSCYATKRPKPIQMSISPEQARTSEFRTPLQARSCKKPSMSVKIPPRDGTSGMKARPTGKSYGDLKKAMRQPISPGGKLASFLNSIFNTKKARITVQSPPEHSDHSACSSASSFSRSCLSVKNPPSAASSSSKRKSTEKRSVRFCPVDIILDEERPYYHKSLVERTKSQSDLGEQVVAAASEPDFDVVTEENRRVVEAAREMLRTYQKRKESYSDDLEDGDNEGDAASCASSDLFELDNFDRYGEELPVYGTTSVGVNLGIANGLMV